MQEPTIPNWVLVGFMLSTLLCLIVFAAWEWWKTIRADRQLKAEREMRIGFPAAKRFGLLPEDTQ